MATYICKKALKRCAANHLCLTGMSGVGTHTVTHHTQYPLWGYCAQTAKITDSAEIMNQQEVSKS